MGWGTGNIGGGSGGLNFKIVGGTAKPSNPKENMIWIITDQKITSYIFSAKEPESPIDGMVWITVGTSSTFAFNALKKNSIQVYPISANQYVGGAWVDKTAKSYQYGEWVEWVTDLFLLSSKGTHNDVTGGWTVPDGYELTKQSDGTHLLKRSGSYGEAFTNNAIDVSEYKTLVIKIKRSSGANNVTFWLEDSSATVYNATSGEEEVKIDLTFMSGEYKVYMSPSSKGCYAYIESIRLVK